MLVNQLLVDFPSAKVVLQNPIWYSPNTHNGATYEESGLGVLWEYRKCLTDAFSSLVSSHYGNVYLGDVYGWNYFSANYATKLLAERGANGVFYLHPNNDGAVQLGAFWANAAYSAIVSSTYLNLSGPSTVHTGEAATFIVSANGVIPSIISVSLSKNGVSGKLSESKLLLSPGHPTASFRFIPQGRGSGEIVVSASGLEQGRLSFVSQGN
jgi:hypothetical protein